MTPDERTVVLEAVVQYTHDIGAGETIVCPASYFRRYGEKKVTTAWWKLTYEEKFLVWLEAPDDDYDYVETMTAVVKENEGARAKLAAIREAKGTP